MTERELLDKALTTLMCALAHDEAVLRTTDIMELAKLREHWVPDAEQVIEEAEKMGLLDDGPDDDFDEEDFDDEDE
jgi:hypothetical protein